jgi:hypothetical protein
MARYGWQKDRGTDPKARDSRQVASVWQCDAMPRLVSCLVTTLRKFRRDFAPRPGAVRSCSGAAATIGNDVSERKTLESFDSNLRDRTLEHRQARPARASPPAASAAAHRRSSVPRDAVATTPRTSPIAPRQALPWP